MLLLLLLLVLLFAAVYSVNEFVNRKMGIKEALFYFKCDGESWIAETAWIDNVTGQVNKIVTTSNWQDGVVSALNGHEKIYHTKQPYADRRGLQRFHFNARNRFFMQMKWEFVAGRKKEAPQLS